MSGQDIVADRVFDAKNIILGQDQANNSHKGLIKMLPHWLEIVKEILPSVAGSAGSILWMKGRPARMVALFVFGCFTGYYLGGVFALYYAMPETVSGYVVGLFGVACIDKVFDFIERTDFLALVSGFILRRGGK